jgi:hypothetical protein
VQINVIKMATIARFAGTNNICPRVHFVEAASFEVMFEAGIRPDMLQSPEFDYVVKPVVSCPSTRWRSFASFQLPPTPMMIFPVGVEHALDMPVQDAEHSDPRVQQRRAILRRHDQGLNGSLPVRGLVLGLR